MRVKNSVNRKIFLYFLKKLLLNEDVIFQGRCGASTCLTIRALSTGIAPGSRALLLLI